MFPITYYSTNGGDWMAQGSERAKYFDIGIVGYEGNVDDRTLSLIPDVPPKGVPHSTARLLDMAVVIRSKDAGINRLTSTSFSTQTKCIGVHCDRTCFVPAISPKSWGCRRNES